MCAFHRIATSFVSAWGENKKRETLHMWWASWVEPTRYNYY